MIKDAIYTSVWDGGYCVTTSCRVNMETKEVFDIEVSEETADFVNNLDEEFVTIDGEKYPVSRGGAGEDCEEYWYD